MKQTINLSDFRSAFYNMDRKDNFSYEGLEVLFDYFEECDPDYELDVIGLCCEFAEADPATIAKDYQIDVDGMDEQEVRDTVEEYLNENTILLGETLNTFIYAQF